MIVNDKNDIYIYYLHVLSVWGACIHEERKLREVEKTS